MTCRHLEETALWRQNIAPRNGRARPSPRSTGGLGPELPPLPRHPARVTSAIMQARRGATSAGNVRPTPRTAGRLTLRSGVSPVLIGSGCQAQGRGRSGIVTTQGLRPAPLADWALGRQKEVPVVRPGRERRFRSEELERFLGQAPKAIPRREALYVRVLGTPGQESSLVAQEGELLASSTGEVVGVFRDRASGLREHRPGLDRVLAPWSRPWAARSTPASQLPCAASSRTPCGTSAPRPAARWSPSLPGGPQPSARGVDAGCATTPPLSGCAAATHGRTARIAGSPRIGTMPPLSTSAPGASAPSQLSTRIPTPGIWRSAKPKTPRWRAALRLRPSLGPTTKPRTHPVPLRRRVLSPPAAAAVNGQRPEGGAPQVGVTSAHGQDTSAQPYPTPLRHRPRWVSLGRGFHRNAHATAVVPRGDFGPKALGYAPAGSCRDAVCQLHDHGNPRLGGLDCGGQEGHRT